MDFDTMTHEQILSYITAGGDYAGRTARYEEVQHWQGGRDKRRRAVLLAAEQARTGIRPDLIVRRTSGGGRGTVKRMFVREDQVMVEVLWRRRGTHSTIRLASLELAEEIAR